MKSNVILFDVSLTLFTPSELVSKILDESNPKVFHLCNVHTLLTAKRNSKFRECLANPSSVNIVDGKVVELLIRMLYKKQRDFRSIRGKDLLELVLEQSQNRDFRNAVIGADLSTIQRAKSAMQKKMTGLQMPVLISPPFTEIEEWDLTGIVHELEENHINLAWVAVGTPKQDLFSSMLYSVLTINYVCVGAAIGFSSGDLRECPRFISRIGFEWLFRLFIEPKRLWRRYLLDIPLLLILIVKQILLTLLRFNKR